MLDSYYSNPNVRRRILEFLGGETLENVSAVYFTADGASDEAQFRARPTSELWSCLDQDQDLEIGRSLWDRQNLLMHLDIEYVNFDFPGEPYLSPERAFELQRPVVQTIRRVLLGHGLVPLHLMSGRGHHFIWQVPRQSQAYDRLMQLGRPARACAEGSESLPRPMTGWTEQSVEPGLASAFVGLGMVVEYLSQQVLTAAQHRCRIPIEMTAVETGPGERGREIVSVDISEYGDPLQTRGVRAPFSAYLKPHQQRDLLGQHVLEVLPPLFMIPTSEMSDSQALSAMRDRDQVLDLAERASVCIPDQSAAMESLITAYATSTLASFHQHFYAYRHDDPAAWPHTYDRTPLETLPACARVALEHPSDLLLKPAEIQHAVRVLMAVGWEPRHIAGLIRSKYERDYGWGERWHRYDPSLRADFYTRIFAGAIVSGLDSLSDFNCRSTQEKRYCPVRNCSSNLLDWKEQLLVRLNCVD